MQLMWNRSEKMWEKQPCRHQGQWSRRGRRCSRHQSRDFPAAFGEDHGEVGCPTAAHGGPWRSRYPPCSLWRTPCWSRWMHLEGSCSLWKVHTGAGFCQELRSVERSPGMSRLLVALVILWGTHNGAVLSWRTVPCGEILLWSRGPVRGGRRGKDEVLWSSLSPLYHSEGRRYKSREWRSEVDSMKKAE